MHCIICDKEVAEAKEMRMVIGLACETCVPRGQAVSFQVRPAQQAEDHQFVLDFLDRLFGETEFIEFGRWYYVQEMAQLVAVTEQGHYVGFAAYMLEPEEPSLMTLLSINVDEAFFRRGVASALWEQVRQIAGQAGVTRIRVPISNDDLASYVFYHRCGFRLYEIDLNLPVMRHGGEEEGFWGLPIKDEFYLDYQLKP
jgi:ribosomal protein S18 acetylase RimI-like enzyme